MERTVGSIILLVTLLFYPSFGQASFEKDVLPTTDEDVEVTFIGHGSLMLAFNGKIIHVDPFSKLADYSQLPKADLIPFDPPTPRPS